MIHPSLSQFTKNSNSLNVFRLKKLTAKLHLLKLNTLNNSEVLMNMLSMVGLDGSPHHRRLPGTICSELPLTLKMI